MKIKNLSKLLAFGVLLNSIPINSFAGILSEDTRYETFIDSGITITDILEEQKSKIKIEGNTLVVNELGEEVEPGTEGAMLKSSFEDNLVTQEMVDSGLEKAENLGKYKVEYKVTGKNKLSINDYYVKSNYSNYLNIENGVITGSYNGVYYDFQLYVYLEKDVNYILSCTETFPILNMQVCEGRVEGWKGDDTVIGRLNANNLLPTIPKTGWYTIHIVNLNQTLTNLQIEEGTTATEYEPYKESINTFYLNSPLLEGDTIEVMNGQAYHVHNSNKVVLDGSNDEKWHDNYTGYPSCTTYRFNGTDNAPGGSISVNSVGDDFIIADKLPWIGRWSDTSEFGISRTGTMLFIYNININNVNKLREWLSENPLTIVYTLAEPIYEPINADLSVKLFEGITHISNNSTIPTTMEITVDRTINRAVEAIELAKTNPTISNISKARMWTNLLDDSIKKDELQNEINDITDIEDLQLERKTATSNVDIYIKSENMLLMSLSTNFITFNDFSGVDDMELSNAINISINSSLPYQLNSYLLSEIENNDKTNRIEKDLLNIKISKDSDYKTFANINEKLILEDDCDAGNNKSHSIDLMLIGGDAHKADIYKTVIKFEAEQK